MEKWGTAAVVDGRRMGIDFDPPGTGPGGKLTLKSSEAGKDLPSTGRCPVFYLQDMFRSVDSGAPNHF